MRQDRIINRYVTGRSILVFGSRATGKAKYFSDVDLAIMGDEPVSFQILGRLRDAFMESDLPFRVDLVDWAATSPEFRAIIARDGVPLR